MTTFFRHVKVSCGSISPVWFMTDIATQFYDAFSTVFECLPKQLYCTWHVDKAWQEQLRSKIGDKEIEAQTYLGLRIVLEQTDEDMLKNIYKHFASVFTALP